MFLLSTRPPRSHVQFLSRPRPRPASPPSPPPPRVRRLAAVRRRRPSPSLDFLFRRRPRLLLGLDLRLEIALARGDRVVRRILPLGADLVHLLAFEALDVERRAALRREAVVRRLDRRSLARRRGLALRRRRRVRLRARRSNRRRRRRRRPSAPLAGIAWHSWIDIGSSVTENVLPKLGRRHLTQRDPAFLGVPKLKPSEKPDISLWQFFSIIRRIALSFCVRRSDWLSM